MANIIPESIDLHIPTSELDLIKAILDSLTVFAFVLLIIVIFYAKSRYPVINRNSVFFPLISFNILGLISSFMDALDEWFWFFPQEFYNDIWKPTRLLLFLFAIIFLVFAFIAFYAFSERLIGE